MASSWVNTAENVSDAGRRKIGKRIAQPAAEPRAGRYDDAERRQAKRSGNERGCWIYLPAAELRKAGCDPAADAPWYRTWGTARGGVFIRLYRKRATTSHARKLGAGSRGAARGNVHLHAPTDVTLGRIRRKRGECLCSKRHGTYERPPDGDELRSPKCEAVAARFGIAWPL